MREFRFSKKWLLFLLLPTAIALVINSCKKQDQQGSQQDQKTRTDQLTAIKQRLDRDGLTYTIPVNQKLEAYFVDKAGNRVPDAVLKKTSTGIKTVDAITSACDFSNTPSATFNSYSLTSVCTSGFTIAWSYTVSSNNNVVKTNSTTGATSKGIVKIYNSANAQVYSATPLAASVSDIGVDSSNPGYELFAVAITSAPIPFSNFASGNTVKLGALLVTDCPDVEAFSIALSMYDINPNGGALANSCDRLDPIQVAQSVAPLRFYGEDPVGVCASGFVYPQLQEIQYSTDGINWVGESPTASLSYWLPPSSIAVYDSILNKHLGYVDPYGALELNISIAPAGSYNVRVRSRNIMFNNALSSYPGSMWPVPVFGANGNCCVGPWSAITTYSVTY
jgi:hypothetical protein